MFGRAGPLDPDGDARALWGVLRRVVDEAGDDLCGAPLIAAHEDRLTRARARELVPARHRRDLLQSRRDGRAQVEAGPP